MTARLIALLGLSLGYVATAQEPGGGSSALAPLMAHVEAHRDGQAVASIDFVKLEGDRSELPIGVFDSGIGGLTVLEAILKIDTFNNRTLQPGADGVPDFAGERFIYFGDQANMPYGNYPAQGRLPFLRELILRDAIFLLGTRYRETAPTPPRFDKPPVKAIVIACNTATAYGLEDIRAALKRWELDVPVIGVVEAGARALAAELPDDDQPRTVAVLATVGTCASDAYPKAIRSTIGRTGKRVPLVVQQGSVGLAGAIEGNQAFVPSGGNAVRYEGPAIGNGAAPIDPALLPVYAFDPAGLKGTPAEPGSLQLSSVGNYARYDVTTLLQKSPPPSGAPITYVMLGCTHFPMAQAELADAFRRTREYRDATGAAPFASAIASDLRFIDPAQATAKELFRELARNRLRARIGESRDPSCRFFLSVPNPDAPGVQLAPDGSLESAYRQGRDPGHFEAEDTVAVPVTSDSLPESARGLVRSLTAVWKRLSTSKE